MASIDNFLKTYNPIKYADIEQDTIEKYKSILPDYFIKLWIDHGLASYNNGFFWTINPDEFSSCINEFFEEESNSIPIFKTAFGHVIYYKDNIFYRYSPVLNLSMEMSTQLFLTIDFEFCYPKILKNLYHIDIYNKAFKRLGPIAYDECYAFVPAIPLGGEVSHKNLQKAKLKEYLYLLAQLMHD